MCKKSFCLLFHNFQKFYIVVLFYYYFIQIIRQKLEDIIQQQATHEAHGHRYNILKEFGTGSLTRSFRALHQLHQYSNSGNQKSVGLSAVVKYHKALGTYPGVVTFSKQIQVYESDNCKALMTEHYDTVSNYIFIIFFLIKMYP